MGMVIGVLAMEPLCWCLPQSLKDGLEHIPSHLPKMTHPSLTVAKIDVMVMEMEMGQNVLTMMIRTFATMTMELSSI